MPTTIIILFAYLIFLLLFISTGLTLAERRIRNKLPPAKWWQFWDATSGWRGSLICCVLMFGGFVLIINYAG